MDTKTPTPQDAALVPDVTSPVAAVLPPGCDLNGCKHHYPRNWKYAAEGCICPAWFDGGGWHLIEQNPACTAHRVVTASPGTPGTKEE